MEKYYERKARRQGAVRRCKNPECDTKLSRYNDSWLCGKCETKDEADTKRKLLDLLS